MGGKVNDSVDIVLAYEAADQRLITHIADDQRRIAHRLPEARVKVVERDHPFAAFEKLEQRVTTDIPGAAGNENSLPVHGVSKLLDVRARRIIPAPSRRQWRN
jgi:hypothetical protein